MHPVGNLEVFTEQYTALSRHYGFSSTKTQPHCPHENGDVEQGHYRLKKTLDQSLMLRGSRDFPSREAYETFLGSLNNLTF